MIKDEKSIIGRKSFRDLHLALKGLIQNSLSFGGVSLLVIEDFLQLAPY